MAGGPVAAQRTSSKLRLAIDLCSRNKYIHLDHSLFCTGPAAAARFLGGLAASALADSL